MLKGGFSIPNDEGDDPALLAAIKLSMNDSQHGISEAIPCQVCFIDLNALSLENRHAHYEQHFSETATHNIGPPLLKAANLTSFSSIGSRSRKPAPEKENLFWHTRLFTPPPSNFTPGLIPVLRRCLARSHGKGHTQKAALCYEQVVHVATQLWDLGWGCGYRNFLMACTALMVQTEQPLYFPLLDAAPGPGVRHLQDWIEEAWQHGYDEEGANQLKHKLSGTRKWIGTGELCIAFNYRGIPAKLVDFDLTQRGPSVLIDWVVSYFSPTSPVDPNATVTSALRNATPILSTNRMPLVLQHSGHSRTIIGYEMTRAGGINLLLFDPSKRPPNSLRNAAIASSSPVPPLHHPSPQSSQTASSVPHSLRKSVSRHMSPSRLLQKVRKRHASNNWSNENDVIDVDADGPAKKRRAHSRGPVPVRDQDNGPAQKEDVICLDDVPPARSATTPPDAKTRGRRDEIASDLTPPKVLSFFRLNAKQLARKDKYQILYFPLTEPLTPQGREQLRVIRSEKFR